jgi:hypothetical protein
METALECEQLKNPWHIEIEYTFVVVRDGCRCRTCRKHIDDRIAIRQTLQHTRVSYYHLTCLKRDCASKMFKVIQNVDGALS